MERKQRISILGSTGSIGKNTLEVISHRGCYEVEALAAYANIDLLELQVREFHPKIIAVYDEKKAKELKKRLPQMHIVSGMEGLLEVASLDTVDIVMSAISGAIGIAPTVTAIKKGKRIALANKEVLVAAGDLVMKMVKDFNAQLIPVDSEHSAIFQALQGSSDQEISRIILTASGGPFFRYTSQEMKHITLEKALKHPTWSMGAKITIDSSTLMNKGLEVIEAYHLFQVKREQIEVIIHPQSIIHSMVEFIDGSMIAQMSAPTMKVPIQYALTYPHREKGIIPPFSFSQYPSLEFIVLEKGKFRCLDLAFEALKIGKSMPCFLNAANEVLVDRFLQKEIGWLDISQKLETLCLHHQVTTINSLDTVYAVDAMARKEAKSI